MGINKEISEISVKIIIVMINVYTLFMAMEMIFSCGYIFKINDLKCNFISM